MQWKMAPIHSYFLILKEYVTFVIAYYKKNLGYSAVYL